MPNRTWTLNQQFPADFYTPVDWGAQVNTLVWSDVWVEKDKLVLHHGGGPNQAGSINPDPVAQVEDEIRQVRSWEAFHLSKPHRAIDYGFLLGQSGNIYVGRGFNLSGAHWNNDDVDDDGIPENHEALAVCAILGSGQSMSNEMREAFHRLWRWTEDILGHEMGLSYHKEVAASGSRYDSTACPGSERIAWIESLRAGGSVRRQVPSPEVIHYCFDSGLAWGDRYYWLGLPADSPEWPYFVAMLKRGLIGWYSHMGHVGGNEDYWLGLAEDSPEWADFWSAVGTTTPAIVR